METEFKDILKKIQGYGVKFFLLKSSYSCSFFLIWGKRNMSVITSLCACVHLGACRGHRLTLGVFLSNCSLLNFEKQSLSIKSSLFLIVNRMNNNL